MLWLSAADRQRISAAALAAYPAECCGLLVGRTVADGIIVTGIEPAANLRPEPDRFELDPAVHLRVQRMLRGTAERVVGHYHSHPNGRAEPSATDLAAAHDPDLVWLIAGCDGATVELAAFRLAGGAFVPIATGTSATGTSATESSPR